MDPHELVECHDCGAHFALTPAMATDGMACSECGGKRLLRSQPSATQSDGALRDMVDPISQRDQGGNPLGEGTIMDGGSAVKAEQPLGKRDNSFPGSGTYGRTLDMDPYMSLFHEAADLPGLVPGAAGSSQANDYVNYMHTQPNISPWEAAAGAATAVLPAVAPEVAGLFGGGAAAAGGADAAATAGESAVAGGGASLLRKAVNPLMKGVLKQFGENAVNGVTDGLAGGGAAAAPQAPNAAPTDFQIGASVIPMLLTADFESPFSVPSVDEQHDDPEQQDQQQFHDGDMNPSNMHNPNLEDSGAMGEDNARSDSAAYQGFADNSPGIERAEMMMPLLMHYHNSPESGEQDPMIRALHETLEKENPGYLNHNDPEADQSLQALIHHHKNPSARGVHARIAHDGYGLPCPLCGSRETYPMEGRPDDIYCSHCNKVAIVPKDTQAWLPGEINHPDPWMDNEPGTMTIPQHWGGVNMQPQQTAGLCAQCGGTMNPGGACPQCGAGQAQHPMQGGGQAQQPPTAMPPAMAGIAQHLALHQGPVTPEQIAAVQQYLIDHHRAEECPNVPLQPQDYAKEMADIARQPNVAPQVDPSQMNQTPPQMPPGGQPGAMPMPDPSQPGAGGQPMQPMSSRTADANNMVPRCPDCHSATTSIIDVGAVGGGNSSTPDENGRCHSCGKVWSLKAASNEILADANNAVPRCPKCKSATTSIIDVGAVGGGNSSTPDENGRCHSCGHVWTLKAARSIFADLVDMPNPAQAQHQRVWADNSGQDLREGQTYELHSPAFPVPDIVRVMRIKPDAIELQLADGIGAQTGHPDLTVTRQEAQLENYDFVPSHQDADAGMEPPAGTPGQSADQVPPIETTDTTPDSNPHTMANVQDPVNSDMCKCGSTMVDHTMSSPETILHECVRCGKAWETKDEFQGRQSGVDLSWINESNHDDFFSGMERAQAMAAAGSQSRSLSSIAAQDERLQSIRQTLDNNRDQRVAGRHFTPSEKRELVDEYGVARNLDNLDLSGTHYTTSYDMTGKANGDNVPDTHLLFGL